MNLPRLRPLLLSLLLGLCLTHHLDAQPVADTAAPRLKLYGIADDEFPIYAWTQKWVYKDSGDYHTNVGRLWPFADSMGFDIIWLAIGRTTYYVDSLHNSPLRDPGRHRLRVNADYIREPGYARAIQFYPFDSVQSPYYVWTFTNRHGGNTRSNDIEVDHEFNHLSEQEYSDLADTGLIASGMAIDYLPGEGRLPQKSYRWFTEQGGWGAFAPRDFNNYPIEPRTSYIALTGHLYTGGTAQETDTVFTVAVYHEVENGRKYLDVDSSIITAGAGGYEYLVDSFAVTKSELIADTSLFRENYRTISHGIDFRWRYGGGPGPLHPLQPHGKEQSIDIRVYWTGKEKAALRSVELRDSIAHLLLAPGADPQAFRKKIMDEAKEILLGSSNGNIANLRTEIIALEVATESNFRPMEFAGFEAMNQLLRDTFNLPRWRAAHSQPPNPQQGDSIGGQQFELASNHFHRMTSQDIIHTYNYLNDPGDTLRVYQPWNVKLKENNFAHPIPCKPECLYDVPHHTIPSFTQMNGGRGHLPELMNLDSVGSPAYNATLEQRVEDYETTLQRMYFGRNDPGNASFYQYPIAGYRRMLGGIGEAARLSRKTGRRYVPVPGTVTNIQLRDSILTVDARYDTTYVLNDQGDTLQTIIDSTYTPLTAGIDTLFSHAPTESELFAITGLGLTYGGTGVLWYQFGSYPSANKVLGYQSDTVYVSHDPCCWGSNGFFTRDTTENVLSPLELHFNTSTNKDDYPATVVATIPDAYIGWRDQTRAAKRINRWLKRIGPELARLRWRDGYSMNFILPWPGSTYDTLFRPLPSNEIVTQVVSRSPFKSKPDSAHRTFVEIGFFDKLTDSTDGAYDPLKDVHHVMLTNRRCFRKPKDTCWSGYCDVTYEDKSVTILDTLAGTRLVSCRLNLRHPDSTGYNYWRVREVEPDTEPLPHDPLAARHTLDTVVAGDSVFTVVLGPGKSTLLRIEPAPPDTSIIAGDLRWPGQRKFIHDGARYHAVFHRARGLSGGGTDNVVVWRWSYPVTDSAGSILWVQTSEVVLSDSLLPGESARTDNRFPSFTLRRIADTSWITVVWTCHPNASGHNGEREVVARNLRVVDIVQPYPYQPITGYTNSKLYTVDYHKGTNPEKWGTPVIGYTHGAAVIAWSDSSAGIIGRLFPLNLAQWTWPAPLPVLSARDSISWPERQTYGFAGQYPTLPPWTPTARADSSLGISWRQPAAASQDILYQRLGHSAANALTTLKPAALILAPWLADRWYPSIDIIQDTSGGDHNEGVVWEDDFNGLKTIQFQSLKTSSAGITSLWNRAAYVARANTMTTTWPSGELYPQTSVLGEHDTSLAGQGRVQFSVGYQRPTTGGTPDLWQALIDWGRPSFKTGWPNRYSYEGRYPNTASNRNQSWKKEAILYQANDLAGTDSTLRTSRQFFAKFSRPTGYQAQGRSVLFRTSEESRAGMQVLLYDPWFADAERGEGLSLVARDPALSDIETLDQVAGLFRTEPFTASDSVTIGCTLYGRCFGDVGSNSLIVILELIDSATGEPVAALDSISLSSLADSAALTPERTLDLLSGTYYLRARFDTALPAAVDVAYDCRYPVTEMAGWVETILAAKGARRIGENVEAGTLRLTAQPNPFGRTTEIRFSIPVRDYASLEVYDAFGRHIATPVERTLFEKGRYGVFFSGENLPDGTYILLLRTSRERAVEKVVVLK